MIYVRQCIDICVLLIPKRNNIWRNYSVTSYAKQLELTCRYQRTKSYNICIYNLWTVLPTKYHMQKYKRCYVYFGTFIDKIYYKPRAAYLQLDHPTIILFRAIYLVLFRTRCWKLLSVWKKLWFVPQTTSVCILCIHV